jgi:lambda family phage minor tail protein L
MLTLSEAGIIEKNELATDGVWLLAVEAQIPGNTLYLVNNTENVTLGGKEYTAFPFSLEDISEDGKELPNVKLTVSNVTGTIQRYVEENNGLGGMKVVLRVYHTRIPDVAEVEEHFVVTGVTCDVEWVTFTLGTDFSFTRRFPPVRMMKDYCPFKFKGIECGYKGSAQKCNKTLKRCRELGNNTRFGGEATIPQGGLYASNNI